MTTTLIVRERICMLPGMASLLKLLIGGTLQEYEVWHCKYRKGGLHGLVDHGHINAFSSSISIAVLPWTVHLIAVHSSRRQQLSLFKVIDNLSHRLLNR